jgi:hypothetical protein
MGLEGEHMPAEMLEGRFLGEVASLECLWRGALRTGYVSWELGVSFLILWVRTILLRDVHRSLLVLA